MPGGGFEVEPDEFDAAAGRLRVTGREAHGGAVVVGSGGGVSHGPGASRVCAAASLAR